MLFNPFSSLKITEASKLNGAFVAFFGPAISSASVASWCLFISIVQTSGFDPEGGGFEVV